ncbi:NADH:flavin oxidoreductase/NADH oxidase [Derxia gummosa]|uniref:NADH:flavin oxidoreductase/NADH oxidase n=1 Tax=Derxia gummosa DSM 723 TaxID=1121388 RepID=A0A8B6X730_9BURK|nr:NADH:flavin oxidoreductase/NADH oxidase [Derxia gummosa]
MPKLFTPLALGPLELPNRIVIAPMCQYSATDGLPADWHLMHYGTLALSGAGLLIVEATAVTPEGRITAADLGLWSDAHAAALARLLASLRRHSAMPLAIQLAHAGRKASSRVPWEGGSQLRPGEPGGWPTLAPSALAHAEGELPPAALDAAGLARIRDAFVAAARRAVDAGFEAIELHGAHGYLLHQFLSPLANRREDDYGGSLANRMRFPLEVFDAVRAALPASVPVWMRVSATDWVEGGWDLDGTVALGRELKARGAAALHVSTGGVSPRQQIPLGPGYQLPHARRVRDEVGLPTIGVGLVTDARQAEQAITEGTADAVALARAMLFDPRWPWHAAAELGARVTAPPQYWRCQPRELKDLFAGAAHAQR